jgi:hypothetical protein
VRDLGGHGDEQDAVCARRRGRGGTKSSESSKITKKIYYAETKVNEEEDGKNKAVARKKFVAIEGSNALTQFLPHAYAEATR